MPKKKLSNAVVKIDDNYRFSIDERNYILESKQVNEKNKNIYWKIEGYYSNIELALKRIVHLEVINKINLNDECSLKDYFNAWKEQLHKFEEILKQFTC